MPITLDGTNGITTPTYGGADTSEYLVPVTQFKNRILNGSMVLDQRNAGASVTPNSDGYLLDRWVYFASQTSKFNFQRNRGSVTTPAGFTNYLGAATASAVSIGANDYFLLVQRIEGFNISDLGWGTPNAQTVTLSFRVYSSLTGTFGGSIQNSASNRSYPFSYTVSSANTWTNISITIPGETTGVWAVDNSFGMQVIFGLGVGSSFSGTAGSWSNSNFFSATGATSVVGTNGATFYITGVQLEVGSTATSFDYRPYGTELALCQRYYWKMAGNDGGGAYAAFGSGQATDSTTARFYIKHPVQMRSSPTYSYNGTINIQSGGTIASATSINGTFGGTNSTMLQMTIGSASFTSGYGVTGYVDTPSTSWLASSAEL